MRARRITGIVAGLLFAGMAQADVFNMGGTRDANGNWTGLASLETVHVGDAGNAADMHGAGYGAVSYEYDIGKYEVTAGQYTEFLNAVAKTDAYGLYNTGMDTAVDTYGCDIKRAGSSGSYTYSVDANGGNRPVNYVSYGDSCRFANWLHNGQPAGEQDANTTERGAYTLDGYDGHDGRAIQRNTDAKWAIPSEDEWYKAAYYKGGSTNAGYWDYPTSSDTAPGRDMADVSGNNSNYYNNGNGYLIGSPYYRATAGEFQNSDSPCGTFDQGGNVWEWNEAIPYQDSTCVYRGMRGSAFNNYNYYLLASFRNYSYPYYEYGSLGFRVVEVPEPATTAFLALGGIGLLRRRWGL